MIRPPKPLMSNDHFSSVAGGYARFRPIYPPQLFAYLAALTPHRRLAWDCATGNGQAAVGLAAHFQRVVGTDLSDSQIGHAASHPRVAYHVAPAEGSGLAAASVDLVTVAQGLHWLDLPRFYAETSRVLAPGGAVAAWCYNLLDVDPRVNAVVGRYYSDVVGRFWPPERRLLEAGYRTVPFPFREAEPPALDMRSRWRLEQLLGYLGTWSATTRYRAARRQDPLELVADDLAAAWGDPGAVKEVRWPLHLRVGWE